jgi:uncharacterized protein (DUF58 family)
VAARAKKKKKKEQKRLTVDEWVKRVRGPDAELFDKTFLTEVEKLYIISKKVFAGALRAERRTKKMGSGVEFAEHRDYSLGDDFRYIDWNLYGRLDKLLLRLFEEEEDLHIYILVDVSDSMTLGKDPKFFYGLRLGAALAYIGLSNLDRVAVVPFSDRMLGWLPPNRGKSRIFKIFDFLKQQRPGGETDLERSLKGFVAQSHRRGVAVVISDFYDPDGYQEGLNFLKYHKYESYIIQVYDRREARPDLMGDLHLIDCETGEDRQVTVSAGLLRKYAAEHERFCRELSEFCTGAAMPFFRTTTDVPFQELVLSIFRMGGFIK